MFTKLYSLFRGAPVHHTNRARLTVQQLEDRCVPSASGSTAAPLLVSHAAANIQVASLTTVEERRAVQALVVFERHEEVVARREELVALREELIARREELIRLIEIGEVR